MSRGDAGDVGNEARPDGEPARGRARNQVWNAAGDYRLAPARLVVADGDAALGPLRPGHYTLCLDGVAAGEFVLNENAAVMLTTGRLWTDGELLHLEPDTPGAILLKLALPGPGTYPVYLTGEDVSRTAVAQIGADDAQDPGGGYTRCVQFEGLMAGCYTLTCRGEAIASLELARGEVKSLALAVN